MKRITAVLLSVVMIVALFAVCVSAEETNGLSFSADGRFRILCLADTQDDQHPAEDMLNLITTAIEESDPDLIVFCGDLVEDYRFGEAGRTDNFLGEGVVVYDAMRNIDREKTLENVRVAADAVLSVFEASGVPFAIVQGNNDHKVGITNADWLEIYSQYSNCLVADMDNDSEGRIDYYLKISGSDGTDAFNLWMLDSGRGGVNAEQLEWYKSESSAINSVDSPVPAFVFQHIPVSDVGNLFRECKATDEGAKYSDSTGKWYRLDKTVARGGNVNPFLPGPASAEFTAWKESGDVIGAFFGHVHNEGFSGKVDGIELGFVYGSQMAKNGPYGYRILELDESDITNFGNDVYTYEGSAHLGTAHFEYQRTVEYTDPVSLFRKLASFISNLFALLCAAISV